MLLGISVVWGALAIGKLFQPASADSDRSTDTPISQAPSESNSPSTPEDIAEKPEDITPPKPNDGTLTKEAAQEIIQAWQKIKAEALGETHQIDQLGQILVDPELSSWEYSADLSEREGEYTTFELKNVSVESVSMESPTQALVRAKITETRDQYSKNQTEPFASFENQTYGVDYRLVSIDGKWRIAEMKSE